MTKNDVVDLLADLEQLCYFTLKLAILHVSMIGYVLVVCCKFLNIYHVSLISLLYFKSIVIPKSSTVCGLIQRQHNTMS